MSLTLRALLLLMFVSVCSQAQTRKLALYAGPAPGLDAASSAAMRTELQRLLAPSEIEIVWRNSAARKPGENFEIVVVGAFDGSCSSVDLPVDSVASLADTSISNGQILPFFRVDCSRVVRMLGSHPGFESIGRALARVVAHEIYHIVSKSTDHHDTGVAKAVFSARDLTNPRFDLDAWSLARMRPLSVARSSSSSSDEGGR